MKRGMPVKPRFSEEQVAQAIEQSHGFVAHAAKMLGCSRRAIDYYIAGSEELRKVRDDARKTMVDIAEAALYKAITEGQAWAVTFFLKCRGGYVDRREYVNLNGEEVDTRKWYGDKNRSGQEMITALHNKPKPAEVKPNGG